MDIFFRWYLIGSIANDDRECSQVQKSFKLNPQATRQHMQLHGNKFRIRVAAKKNPLKTSKLFLLNRRSNPKLREYGERDWEQYALLAANTTTRFLVAKKEMFALQVELVSQDSNSCLYKLRVHNGRHSFQSSGKKVILKNIGHNADEREI